LSARCYSLQNINGNEPVWRRAVFIGKNFRVSAHIAATQLDRRRGYFVAGFSDSSDRGFRLQKKVKKWFSPRQMCTIRKVKTLTK